MYVPGVCLVLAGALAWKKVLMSLPIDIIIIIHSLQLVLTFMYVLVGCFFPFSIL